MPRNVRNFWLELDVNGRGARVETGPRSKDGGFELVVLQRDRGNVTRAGRLVGRVDSEGKISLYWDGEGQPDLVTLNTTER